VHRVLENTLDDSCLRHDFALRVTHPEVQRDSNFDLYIRGTLSSAPSAIFCSLGPNGSCSARSRHHTKRGRGMNRMAWSGPKTKKGL
jgi:hypothetical protein